MGGLVFSMSKRKTVPTCKPDSKSTSLRPHETALRVGVSIMPQQPQCHLAASVAAPAVRTPYKAELSQTAIVAATEQHGPLGKSP